MRENMPEHNGHRTSRRGRYERDWPANVRDAFGALQKMDVPDVIRKNPYPAMAVAGAVGLMIGITVGSRMVRMIIGSIGMYALGELGRRYAREALENMDFEGTIEEPSRID